MKTLIKQQLKAIEITQESFCEKHGYDKTNFPKKINKIIRDIDKAKEVLSKLDIEILIAPQERKSVGKNIKTDK